MTKKILSEMFLCPHLESKLVFFSGESEEMTYSCDFSLLHNSDE